MEALERAEQLRAELDSLRPLESEAEGRIMQKFRLDWNYHSNNIEGNSLTYGETKALILFGITAQGKPLKDHFEITGHNDAINWVLDLVKGETALTEVFIRELHTLLLKESGFKDAQTSDGKPTRRKIEVGKYKTQPNHVITITGETFYFASPEETPAKMQELVEWFRSESAKPDINRIILAALFHYRFIRIHPFDDGNGRVARILMNFILMQFGYPPVIIKTEDKENYYAVLRLADADQLEPFIEYIATNLVRSLEIMIRGAKGENIEEPDDFDKALAILDRKISTKEQKYHLQKNPELLSQLEKSVVRPMIHEFIVACQKFDRFYLENEIVGHYLNTMLLHGDSSSALKDLKNLSSDVVSFPSFYLVYHHKEFKNPQLGSFDSSASIEFSFNEFTFSMIFRGYEHGAVAKLEKPYDDMALGEELEGILTMIKNTHKILIEKQLGEAS